MTNSPSISAQITNDAIRVIRHSILPFRFIPTRQESDPERGSLATHIRRCQYMAEQRRELSAGGARIPWQSRQSKRAPPDERLCVPLLLENSELCRSWRTRPWPSRRGSGGGDCAN